MDGTLWAEDTPGGGLTIVVDLPTRPGRRHPRCGRIRLVTFVLVVDDEPHIRRTLSINLRARDYEVETAADGRSALQILAERTPDVVVLDLGLPDLDGVDVLRRLRDVSPVPVIVLSARHDSDDKVEALDAGADDYVTKPFGMDEFLARIRAAVRRGSPENPEPLVVTTDDFTLDIAERRATGRDGSEIRLTPTEWRLLDALARRAGHLVTHTELLRAAWGPALRTRAELPPGVCEPAAPQARTRPGGASLPAHRTGDRLPVRRLSGEVQPGSRPVIPTSRSIVGRVVGRGDRRPEQAAVVVGRRVERGRRSRSTRRPRRGRRGSPGRWRGRGPSRAR